MRRAIKSVLQLQHEFDSASFANSVLQLQCGFESR